MDDDSIYSDGTYRANNPSWHAEDAAWKAGKIKEILSRTEMHPCSIVEVGCGSGQVLVELSRLCPETDSFLGLDISPEAIAIASQSASGNLLFEQRGLEAGDGFDLAMAIDVFEHVEDLYGFIRALKRHSKRQLFHIPLELSLSSISRPSALVGSWHDVGHIHFFTRETAIATLEQAGLRILDLGFTHGGAELGAPRDLPRRVTRTIRRATTHMAPALSARVVGGSSLLVLSE